METVWFWLVAVMIAVYVVLDGFDLGAGILHLAVARTGAERRLVIRSIGPVWDGNEVWLLAAGGTLYFAFPALYAASFSGFYLPLMIVLWLLILRGMALEFRNHVDSPAWQPFWDVVFSGASLLLAIFYGAALGGVVRGVPLDASGYFFAPLWTDFRVGPPTGIIDWYTVLVGLFACLTLALHGALWLALKTEGDLQARARQAARLAWPGVVAGTAIVTFVTFGVQPHVPGRLAENPWGYVFPSLALAGLGAARYFLSRAVARGAEAGSRDDLRAFLASCAFITGMLVSVVFGLYPYVLPANTDPAFALTVRSAAASSYGLRIGLVWWIPGMLLAAGYFTYTYRHFAGKVDAGHDGY